MQKLFLRLAAIMLVVTAILSTGCEDTTTPENPLPPEISFVADADVLAGDAQLEQGVVFTVRVSAITGDNPLKALTVYEDGTQISTSRIISINNGAITANNPFLITGVDKDGATYDISILSSDVVGDFHSYTFEVIDDANETDAVTLNIETIGPATTPIDGTYEAKIINNTDGPNQGSFDLDSGTTVSLGDATADIRDMGIDINQPLASNWIRKIEALGNFVIRTPDLSQVEGFSFDDVDSREVILAAWDSNPTDQTETNVLEEGDIFVVNNGSSYWLVRVTQVNITPADNRDFYVIDVKYTL